MVFLAVYFSSFREGSKREKKRRVVFFSKKQQQRNKTNANFY